MQVSDLIGQIRRNFDEEVMEDICAFLYQSEALEKKLKKQKESIKTARKEKRGIDFDGVGGDVSAYF